MSHVQRVGAEKSEVKLSLLIFFEGVFVGVNDVGNDHVNSWGFFEFFENQVMSDLPLAVQKTVGIDFGDDLVFRWSFPDSFGS